MLKSAAVLSAALLLASTGVAADLPAYKNTALPFGERAADLVSRMTVGEKITQMGSSWDRVVSAVPRLGVTRYHWWNEALHGVARNGPATSYPTGIGFSLTWDPELIRYMASFISDEGREKFATQDHSETGLSYWSPTLNMARDPRWGRNEETYGEDPFLAGAIGTAFVRGLQGDGEDARYLKAMATPKHFLGNNSEVNRLGGNSNIDVRDMHEYYLPAFKAAMMDGDARSVMTAFNAIGGRSVTIHNDIMNGILRKTWGFDGYVVTDCDAVSTSTTSPTLWRPKGFEGLSKTDPKWRAKAVAMALDCNVDYNCGRSYISYTKSALDRGYITEDAVDRALVRDFTARMQTGEFDPPEKVPYMDPGRFGRGKQIHAPAHDSLAEDLADQAVVLLKNDPVRGEKAPLLPLGKRPVRSLVLVGPMAEKLTLGGYSTHHPGNTSTALQGIRAALKRNFPEASFTYVRGRQSGRFLQNVCEPEMLDASGKVIGTIDFGRIAAMKGCRLETKRGFKNIGYVSPAGGWIRFAELDIPQQIHSFRVRMSGEGGGVLPTAVKLRQGGPDGMELALGKGSGSTGDWEKWETVTFRWSNAGAQGCLKDVCMVFEPVSSNGGFSPKEAEAIRNADAVVFFGGTDESTAFESRDRTSLRLPFGQEGLIGSLLKLNPRTAVYLQAVGMVDIEAFRNDAPAILWSTYNGQAQGNAAGRILFGESDPSAKTTFTWYADESQLDGILDYRIRTRKGPNPSFGRTYRYFSGDVTYPFGYGLTYSEFRYSGLTLSRSEASPNDTLRVSFDVTNVSGRDGTEIVQVYARGPKADKISRPAKQLCGFGKQFIKAGRTARFSIDVKLADLFVWDPVAGKRTYDEGRYVIEAGPNSRDCEKMTAAFTMKGQLDRKLMAVSLIPSGNILSMAKPNKAITLDVAASGTDDTQLKLPEEAAFTLSVNNPGVVTLRGNTLLPRAPGTATVTVRVTYKGVSKTASVPVCVTP